MSEFDERYARWYEPALVALIIGACLVVIIFHRRTEITDLQRRVAVLEQSKVNPRFQD